MKTDNIQKAEDRHQGQNFMKTYCLNIWSFFMILIILYAFSRCRYNYPEVEIFKATLLFNK